MENNEINDTKTNFTCPCCGVGLWLPNLRVPRAKIGEGTRSAKHMKLNKNRLAILEVLAKYDYTRPRSVRQIQNDLVNCGFKRESKRGAGWNYHTVQVDLSILIGMKKVEMTKVKEEWDSEYGHTTKTTPKYRLNEMIQ